MVRARERFLATGAYAPIRAAIAALAEGTAPPSATVVDVGCGTGYYLAGVLDALPEGLGLGLDSSARALQAAAKAHLRAAAVGSDAFGPFPVASASTDLVIDAFAPRNPEEFRRVLRPDGSLIVARPGPEHLQQLRRSVTGMVGIDPDKEERLRRALDPWFEEAETEQIDFVASLDPDQAADLISMSPSARHLSADRLTRDAVQLPTEIDISVRVTSYRAR